MAGEGRDVRVELLAPVEETERPQADGVIHRHDEQAETKDADRLDEPRLAVERVGDKALGAHDWDEAANHLEADPVQRTLEDKPAIAGALVEGTHAAISQVTDAGDEQR